MKSIWTTYFLPADTDNDLSISAEELVGYMRSAMSDESKRISINATLPLIFAAIDANHDDGVSPAEFHNYFVSMGVTDNVFTETVFKAMDSNNDGDLSKDGELANFLILFLFISYFLNYFNLQEFTAFGQEFFLSSDESSPSKYFFGPLI